MRHEARLRRLERLAAARERKAKAATSPGYVSVKDESEIGAAVAAAGGFPVKIYVGCSPDDWDDQGMGNAAGETHGESQGDLSGIF